MRLAILGGLIVIALLAALVLRYEMVPMQGNTGAAYVLDRWTGQVTLIAYDEAVLVKPTK